MFTKRVMQKNNKTNTLFTTNNYIMTFFKLKHNFNLNGDEKLVK